jgi:hypothetical protein
MILAIGILRQFFKRGKLSRKKREELMKKERKRKTRGKRK